MREIVATVTSKGQVTIPVEIRKRLGLDAGTKVVFVVDDEGQVSLQQPMYPSVDSLSGAAGKLVAPMTWEDMRRVAYEDRFVAKYGKRA